MTPNDQKIAEAMRKNPQQGFKLLIHFLCYGPSKGLIVSNEDGTSQGIMLGLAQ